MMDADQTEKVTAEGRLPKLLGRYFIGSAVVILVTTALAKLWSVSAPGQMLLVTDPITGLAFGRLLLLVGLAELAIAAVCVFGRSPKLKLVLIVWLATSFVVYRLGLWWMGWKKPCGCLGNITDALGITPQTADHIVKVLLAYLLIGSYGLLIWQWRRRTHGQATVVLAPQPRDHKGVLEEFHGRHSVFDKSGRKP